MSDKKKVNVGTIGHVDHECSFNFDLERMKAAVESPAIEMPSGLTREEKRMFILDKCTVPKINSLEDFNAWLDEE